MADTHTKNLCTEIIHSHFGPLASEVTCVLLTRGRLSFSQLLRYSKIKPRSARACILVLLQHNVLWHSMGEDEVEVFEVNVDECLMRLRFGRFIWLSQQIFGQTAAEIIQTVLEHGKLRSPEVLSLIHAPDSKKISQYHSTFHKLVTGSYLKPSTVLSHKSARDRLMQYEMEEKRTITGFPTAKELRHAKDVADARLKREEEEEEQIGMKRKAKDISARPTKRKAIEIEDTVNETVYFRVNYEKFSIHTRNKIIERAAMERFNSGASIVMKAILNTTESAQLKLSEPRTTPTSIPTVMLQLPDGISLADGLAYSKKVPLTTCVKDYLVMLSVADNPSSEGRAGSFISYSASKIQVEFETIARTLRRKTITRIAQEKHGSEGARIVTLLLNTGKLDEKQISKLVMMAPKDVRPLLVSLSADSLISTQEVPKSADRNPTRTFYLWYVDVQKAFSVILGNVYKSLYNIILRRRAERENGEVAAVLEKRERRDVSHDESLLTRLEREALQTWEAKEIRLAVLEMRVEEMVFVVKDLAPLCSGEV